MKRLLYVTTALIGLAGAAHAQIALNHQQDGYRDTGCDPEFQVPVEGTNYFNNPTCPSVGGSASFQDFLNATAKPDPVDDGDDDDGDGDGGDDEGGGDDGGNGDDGGAGSGGDNGSGSGSGGDNGDTSGEPDEDDDGWVGPDPDFEVPSPSW